jgi:SSS family solute:Na+ symporter
MLPPERSQLLNAGAGIGFDFWIVYLVVIILSYNGATWGLAQRFISVADPKDTQKAALLSGFLFLLYPLVIFIPAWASPLLLPEFFDPSTLAPRDGFVVDQTYVRVALHYLSDAAPGLIGLLVCSMFAATMSMIDSDINALAGVFTKDVFERNARSQVSAERMARVARIATVVFGTAVVVTGVLVASAEGMNKVFSATVKLFGAILPPIAIPLMFGMLWKRTTARGAILSVVGGFATFAALKNLYPDSFAIYTGGEMLVAFAIYFGEGLISRRSEDKEREVEALFERLEGEGGS